jgi:hypothetical protein
MPLHAKFAIDTGNPVAPQRFEGAEMLDYGHLPPIAVKLRNPSRRRRASPTSAASVDQSTG